MTNARELSSRLLDLLRREQSAMAEFLVALAAFDERRLWADLGYTSLFYFLHRELRLSAGAAFYRKAAAELIRHFPEVVEPLRDGRLCLTSVAELAKVLTPENRAEVLPRFFHASKQEAKAVAAEISPRQGAPHRMVVTTVAPVLHARQAAADSAAPTPVASPALGLGQPLRLDETHVAQEGALAPLPAIAPPAPPRTTIEPLSADLRRLHVTVSKRFMEKLEAARDALSHSHPGADAEAILEAGLDLLLERAAKRNCTRPKACTRPEAEKVAREDQLDEEQRGRNDQPRKQSKNPRFIPAAVKREVWIRDGGSCQFRLENGELCGSTHRLQFDHVRPVALGGESTVGNIRLACAPHNLLAARRAFGDALMDRYAPARTTGALLDAR
jgi:5-methylcytosine-specific restriction endonuclease McrA